VIPHRLAQKLVDAFCDEVGLPPLPVKLVKHISAEADGESSMGVFMPDGKYEIHYIKNTKLPVFYHELCHYVVDIMKKADDLEELLANVWEQGFEKCMEGNVKTLAVIKEIKRTDK